VFQFRQFCEVQKLASVQPPPPQRSSKNNLPGRVRIRPKTNFGQLFFWGTIFSRLFLGQQNFGKSNLGDFFSGKSKFLNVKENIQFKKKIEIKIFNFQKKFEIEIFNFQTKKLK
jgi:hypothetical protein